MNWNPINPVILRGRSFSYPTLTLHYVEFITKATGMWGGFAPKLYCADIRTCAVSWFRHHSIRLGLAQYCTRFYPSITCSFSSFIVLCLPWGSPFFMRSGSISSIGQYSTPIAPFSTWSQTKRSWTSTSLSGLLHAPWLAQKTIVGTYFDIPRSRRRYWSRISSFPGLRILLQLSIEQPLFASFIAS